MASQYAKLGIGLKCANTERVSGWAEVLHRLGDPSNGVPARLFIHERCARLIECLPSLQHDPNRPEDVLKVDADEDGVGGDDTADCMRYLVATKSRVVAQQSCADSDSANLVKVWLWPRGSVFIAAKFSD